VKLKKKPSKCETEQKLKWKSADANTERWVWRWSQKISPAAVFPGARGTAKI